MFFRKNVGIGYGAYWRGIVFDREYKNLDDLIAKSKRWFPQFKDGAKWLASKSDLKWVWPTGEELLFRQIKRTEDYWNYHGQEFPFIGWNELAKYPTPDLYDTMMSCNRSSFLPAEHSPRGEDGERKILPDLPLVVFSTTNPYGPGHNWVKSRFIDPAPPGQVIRNTAEVYNPRTKKREEITKTQVRVFGSYKENKYLSPEYVLELESIKDESKRKAWLWGDWDIVAGGALDDLWGPHLILPRFPIPAGWRIDRSMDWGSTQPFSVGWWAETNGEEVTLPDGRVFCPEPGTLIRIFEWYGTMGVGLNKGVRMSARDVARGIKEHEACLRSEGWISDFVRAGPADNAIHNVNEKESESVGKKMSDEGVNWMSSDKKQGSRKNGFQLVRDRLQASADGDGKGLFIMDCCRASIATLPTLPRDADDEDDVDTEAEDHIYDDIRYRVLSGQNRFVTDINVKWPN
jgi:hypothetical protein